MEMRSFVIGMISNIRVRLYMLQELLLIGVGVIMTVISYTPADALRIMFQLFLKSRRSDKTRAYALAILDCLSNQLDEDIQKMPLDNRIQVEDSIKKMLNDGPDIMNTQVRKIMMPPPQNCGWVWYKGSL